MRLVPVRGRSVRASVPLIPEGGRSVRRPVTKGPIQDGCRSGPMKR